MIPMNHLILELQKPMKIKRFRIIEILEPFRIWQFDLVEYVQSNWNLISLELLRWNT